MFNAKEIKNKCVEWIREWFEQNGKGCNAVIGISGGKDSSVVAALCVEALGKNRVVGVLMPNGIQKDICDSVEVANFLGIKYAIVNIEESVCAILNTMSDIFTPDRDGYEELKISEQTRINLPPRIRMATLYAVSQSVNGRVANTCNLSEDFIGYSTRWGDSVGDFSPLASLTSDEVVAIGVECGLPHNLVYKVPSDGLCGKTDEDNFGFTYKELNDYIRKGTSGNDEVNAKIYELRQKNLFKLKPIPYFLYER